jgi:hypothetical protein
MCQLATLVEYHLLTQGFFPVALALICLGGVGSLPSRTKHKPVVKPEHIYCRDGLLDVLTPSVQRGLH